MGATCFVLAFCQTFRDTVYSTLTQLSDLQGEIYQILKLLGDISMKAQ
jgi:hypothetical protein